MENKKNPIQIVYSEPEDYFPRELRQKHKLGEYAEVPMLEKIKAVMLGHAVGDALGVPVEFSSREELDEKPVTEMLGYGIHPVPAGCWSDDTSMSLAALDVLADGKLDFDEIMIRFGEWYYDNRYTPTGSVFDVGGTCRRAMESYFEEHKRLKDCGLTEERSNGNGSLMRIHPFVLYATLNKLEYWNWMNCIKAASALTHAHDRSVMACVIYGYLLTFLLNKASKESLREGIQFARGDLDYLPEFAHYHRLLEPEFEQLPREKIKSSGYVVDTLEAALWCVLTTDSYRECVLKAVNLGEDTDTVSAVAGGLAGALYGYHAIPTDWLDTLKKKEYIEELCVRASKCWNKK